MTGRLVLLRHGQSYGNVERRLDTRPPGAALTDLGVDQARDVRPRLEPPRRDGRALDRLACDADRVAIGDHLSMETYELEGIHEVQAGDLEDRNDDEAVEVFQAMNRAGIRGDLDAALPGGESGQQVLDRYVPVLTQLRMRYLDDHDWTGDIVVVSHGAAIRLVLGVWQASTATSHSNIIWPTPNAWCSAPSPTGVGVACSGAALRRRSIPTGPSTNLDELQTADPMG